MASWQPFTFSRPTIYFSKGEGFTMYEDEDEGVLLIPQGWLGLECSLPVETISILKPAP